jgi:protein involved in polysaccharide export with SLBB domain
MVAVLGWSWCLAGCAALTNPIADGPRARDLDPALLGKPKDPEVPLPLNLLGQEQPATYRLAPGDILGVWIEGIHGDRAVIPPFHTEPIVPGREQRPKAPGVGYPYPVADDGSVDLPLVGAVPVANLTLTQAREAIRKAYLSKELLPAGRERLFVTLLQPRSAQVVVLRQEFNSFPPTAERRGSGNTIDLPAYENDVLHALAQTGGLPGLDAYDQVIIYRGFGTGGRDQAALLRSLESDRPPSPGTAMPAELAGRITCIPLRVPPQGPIPFQPEDVILHTGDVVYLQARDRGVYFTGGLMPAGEFPLPRDHDLDVVEAISRARGPMVNGGFAINNLAGNIIEPGIGAPSPSLLTVLRRLPNGGRQQIRVDLNCALRGDPRELLRVQPGDVLILQEKPSEALARYITQTFVNFSLSWQVLHQRFATGVVDVSAPERIPSRVNINNFNNFPVP